MATEGKAPWYAGGGGNEGYEQTLERAQLLYYPEVVDRARQAFALANAARALYRSPADAGMRIRVVEQAVAWNNILRYLEERSANRFTIDGYRLWEARLASRLGRLVRLFSPYCWYMACRMYIGKKPLAWRKLPPRGGRCPGCPPPPTPACSVCPAVMQGSVNAAT